MDLITVGMFVGIFLIFLIFSLVKHKESKLNFFMLFWLPQAIALIVLAVSLDGKGFSKTFYYFYGAELIGIIIGTIISLIFMFMFKVIRIGIVVILFDKYGQLYSVYNKSLARFLNKEYGKMNLIHLFYNSIFEDFNNMNSRYIAAYRTRYPFMIFRKPFIYPIDIFRAEIVKLERDDDK